jgi:hypothetical protein
VLAYATVPGDAQGILTHRPPLPLHHSRVGGETTNATLAWSAGVQAGKSAAVFTVSATEYTPFAGSGGCGNGLWLLHVAAIRTQIENNTSLAAFVISPLDLMRRSSLRRRRSSRGAPRDRTIPFRCLQSNLRRVY